METSSTINSQVAAFAYLENTRILAKGIEGLYTQYRHANGAAGTDAQWTLVELKQFIQETYRTSIHRDSGKYLPQNPHFDLFSFRYPEADASREGEEAYYQMASMLQMYWKLTCLEEDQRDTVHAGGLSSEYELICNCMRELLCSNMCYLAYRRLDDTRVLAASSIREKDLKDSWKSLGKTMFGTQEIATLLDQLYTPQSEVLDDSQWLPDGMRLLTLSGTPSEPSASSHDTVESRIKFLVIPLGLDRQDADAEEQIYLIFHFGDTYPFSELSEWLSHLRDALFLRGRLIKVLSHDLFQLLNDRNEYRGIRRKNAEGKPLRILHLSDLHVEKGNSEDILACIEKLEVPGKFDFMVITGDVAQGRCSAGELEINYLSAAQVIRALAFRIWAVPRRENELVLEQDWKKRLIIIPGNHDYASMNELETQHDETHRASISGRPAATEGSAMAKFTYYINFLRQLLDIDVGTLIDDGMNELRSYDEMKISFLSLNTSIMANPIRNNKVHLDSEFVDRVTTKLNSGDYAQNQVVCLCHHGPDYDIDYVSDQYYESLICEEITKTFRDYFRSQFSETSASGAASSIASVTMEEMETCWEHVEHASEAICAGKMLQGRADYEELLQNESVQAWLWETGAGHIPVDIVKRIQKKRQKSRLYADYRLLSEREAFPGQHKSSEQYQKIVSSIQLAANVSKSDSDSFGSEFDKLYKTGKISVTLSGHTHKRSQSEGKNRYTADRFFGKHIRLKPGQDLTLETVFSLNYGICELPTLSETNNGAKQFRYQFLSSRFLKDNTTGKFALENSRKPYCTLNSI